jgi:hypothetical protein
LYLSLKNTLYVESNTAPFIAAAARRPGAMNAAYGIGRPSGAGSEPTRDPSPCPIATR